MTKDYQEVEAFKAKLWELGLTAKDIDVDAFLTTYGNARELQGVEKAKKEVEEYSKGIAKLHDRMIGSTHEDCKMMLAFDMHSRRVAIKHITKRLDHIAKVKSELK